MHISDEPVLEIYCTQEKQSIIYKAKLGKSHATAAIRRKM